MEITIFVIVALVIVCLVVLKPKSKPNDKTPITSKGILTIHEQKMFRLLRQAVPECYIFPQVAFSAIITTKSRATRNTFNRKINDFVITDTTFGILAIVELDDNSHNGREAQDAERDAMLKEAGYKVLRYRYMPKDIAQLRNDILG